MIQLVWWLWFVMALGALFTGAFFAAIAYFVYDYYNMKKLKAAIPKDPKILMDGGDTTKMDVKEVQDNDREKFSKYREFEKLRREVTRTHGSKTSRNKLSTNRVEQKRRDIPNEPVSEPKSGDRSIELD